MTCRMATGKQKKRLINSIDTDQCRPGKKTKFHSSNSLVTLNPHIGLKWDQHLKRVVPAKEQVGLLWSDLAPFIERPKHHSGLADVTYVSPETFSFENLRDMLSYEVWTTSLTEDERKFLIQFLPSDTDVEESVHSLLTGENLHFGNPFLSWSSSLCYGDIHPDAVLNKEKHVKSSEKAHRVELYNYHSNMVETLKKWRKRWLSCGDTENLFSDNPAKKKQGTMQVAVAKGGMPLKVSQSVDVSKFMSYIEISRTQLNHIKRLKQSGDGIQTKHVSRVVGGLDKFPVKPIGALMEGEQIRLREYWLNMVHKDLPAAFEAIKDRKALMEKSIKLLGLELGEKNVSVLRKADQLSDVRKDLGHCRASENDGRRFFLNDQVEHSPESILQGRNDQSTSLQEDDENTKYMETSSCQIEGSNVKDFDRMVFNSGNRSEQISDEQNEDRTGIKLYNKDTLGVLLDEIPKAQYEDTTSQNLSPENQQINSINCTSMHIHCQNMQIRDLDGIADPSIHERDQDLNSISNAMVNCGNHVVNVPAEKKHTQMTVITGREEAEHSSVILSCSSSLLPKSSAEQIFVDEFMDSNDHLKGVKDRWQMTGPPQSFFYPPENRMYEASHDLQVTQSYLSSGQQSSSAYAKSSVLGQQLTHVTTSAFPMDNSTSFIETFSNQQNHGHLQSTALQTNNCLAESAPFAVREQQLVDQSHTGLFAQQLYSGVRFPNSGNPPIAEQHSYPAFAPMDHHRYNNWPIEGDQLHNNNSNLSGLESGNSLTQALPSGSNSDGSLFSAISHYRLPPGRMEPGRSNPSQLLEPGNQVLPPHNFVPRPQDPSLAYSGIYSHTQNEANSTSSHVASVGSLNNMNWTNFIQQNPGMPDLKGRQFQGSWTR